MNFISLIINIHWPVWGLFICIFCSILLIGALIYWSVHLFRRYNLQIRVNKTKTNFLMKDSWFSEAIHLLWFLFPIFLSIAIIIFNILAVIASAGR